MNFQLVEFIVESNQIEGITHPPTDQEIAAHERLLALPQVRVADLERFVADVAGEVLRRQPNLNVVVGGHVPPAGGPHIESELRWLLDRAHTIDDPHTTHVNYELLHPFRDGNGRSGRALWAWQMRRQGLDPFIRPFLQTFYYQTLDAARVV
jgi:hypothetical protein